jgi:metal-responsive CopG/Arc/MetJ family transcriptional regulator
MATTVRTTLALPADLLAEADRVVRAGGARSRNELVARAILRELAAIERKRVDDAFAGMGADVESEREAEQIMAEFAQSDYETWRDIPD